MMGIRRWFWFHFWYHRYWYWSMIKDFFTLKANKPVWHNLTVTYDGYIKTTYLDDKMIDQRVHDNGFTICKWFKGDIEGVNVL